jgi:hypothetical protein
VGLFWPRVNIFAMLVQFLAEARDFSLLSSIQTGLLSDGYWSSSPRGEAENLPPSSVKVKNSGAILPFPHTSSLHGA